MTTTSKFPLRMTPAERDMIEAAQKTAGEAGVMVSLNDIVRHMIRMSQVPVPTTEAEARAAIERHWSACELCDPEAPPKCLDGLQARQDFVRATWPATAAT